MLTVSRSAFDFCRLKRHLWWTIILWKCVVQSDKKAFQESFFWRNECCVLETKDKDHPDSHQQEVQMPCSAMLWGCVCAFCEDNGKAQNYFETKYVPFEPTSFLGRPMHISTRRSKTSFRTHYEHMGADEVQPPVKNCGTTTQRGCSSGFLKFIANKHCR